MVDRRFIQDAFLDDTWVPASDSSASCSLAATPLTTALGGRVGASPLVILLMIGRLWGRPSCVRVVAIGMREVGATDMGARKGATVVVLAEVVWVVVAGMEPCVSSCAGVAFLLFEVEESRGGPRPKDRPTADAPTTVAVAQSCVTKMRQSMRSVRLGVRYSEAKQATSRAHKQERR